jgi:hypothetical protein
VCLLLLLQCVNVLICVLCDDNCNRLQYSTLLLSVHMVRVARIEKHSYDTLEEHIQHANLHCDVVLPVLQLLLLLLMII